jgi:hypothetical protein
MPRTTERSRLLATIAETQEALGLHLAAQLLMDETLTVDEEEEGEDIDDADSTDEDEEGFDEMFHQAAFEMLEELGELQTRVLAVRYVAHRRVWWGLREDRRTILEWYFSMDVKWFKAKVRQLCSAYSCFAYERTPC